jgi:hypothetical protein
MAVGANFDMDIPHGGARLDDMSAGANDLGGFVLRMNSWLHEILSIETFYNTTIFVLQLGRRQAPAMNPDSAVKLRALERGANLELVKTTFKAFKLFQPNNLGLIRPLADKTFGTVGTFGTIGTNKLS